jgi:MFS family permease
MLSLGALFIVAGRAGDIVGRRRTFVFGCVLFTTTMIGTALAPTRARAGEASGIALTFLVTLGGIGLAVAASIISALERSGHTARSAQETTLAIYALVSISASDIVMTIRAYLVRRGLMKPLSMAADRAAEPVPAATGAGGQDGPGG